MKRNNLLIAIPTYNEHDNVSILYKEIKKIQPRCDILFIDDNSPDGTGDVIDTIMQGDSTVFALHRPRKLGLGTAHIAAFDFSRKHKYTYLITMDADLTHDPRYIPAMMTKASESADIVIGSRYATGAGMKHWGMIRLPLTYFWRNMIKNGLGMPFDCTGAFRIYKVAILNPELYKNFNSKGFSFCLESMYYFNKEGMKIAEVPIQARSRINGKSKLSLNIMSEVLKHYCKLLFDRMTSKKKPLNHDQ